MSGRKIKECINQRRRVDFMELPSSIPPNLLRRARMTFLGQEGNSKHARLIAMFHTYEILFLLALMRSGYRGRFYDVNELSCIGCASFRIHSQCQDCRD
jgi:hypothetical protein